MDVIRVEGGHPITGEVTVEGAKNSALKLMAASIMAPGRTTLSNVPNISDVHIIFKLHLFLGLTILLLFPFTRLVHMLSAPVRYLWRGGYQIVRSRRSLSHG